MRASLRGCAEKRRRHRKGVDETSAPSFAFCGRFLAAMRGKAKRFRPDRCGRCGETLPESSAMMEPSIDSEEDAAMPFPDSVRRVSFRDALHRIPKPALAGAAVLLFCAFAGVVVGFESCAPEPTFTLSKSAGEPSDADEADVSEDEPGDRKSEGGSGFSAAKDSSEAGSAPSAQAVVYVSGAVASPGVYMLAEGSRVGDAVSAAGGFATMPPKRRSISRARYPMASRSPFPHRSRRNRGLSDPGARTPPNRRRRLSPGLAMRRRCLSISTRRG